MLTQQSLPAIPILFADECERVRTAVFALEDHWISRAPGLPFHTLGTASYLDASNGRAAAYLSLAAETNPLLRESFAWLYERLVFRLGEVLGGEYVYDARLAMPGFHVFRGHPQFAKPMASIHFDLQYQELDWSEYSNPRPDSQLSLTLTIKLPHKGAGLRVWEIDFRETGMDKDKMKALLEGNRKAAYVPYAEGNLVIHSGHQLHQIAPMKEPREQDLRLTLQAHAMPIDDGKHVLYW